MKSWLLVLVLLSGCSSTTYFRDAGAPPEPAAANIETWPHRDLWTGVVFNGQKVNGIAYSGEHGGFLYHSWNEAWIAGRGWQPVDATFGQAHADATHVKLIEGETAAELVPIVNLVGRVRVQSVSALRW